MLFWFLFLEMDLRKRWSLEVKKATAVRAKMGESSSLLVKVGLKRKGQGNDDRPSKKMPDPPACLE